MAQASAVAPVSEARVNSFIAQVFLVMSIGLLITALVSTWVSTNLRALWRINSNPWIPFGLFIIQIIIVVAISGAVMRMSPAVAGLLFLFYSALTGLTLSSIFLVYTSEQIATVFWITAGTFLVTSLIGLVLKRDLSSSGSLLMMLLLGWIIAWTISFIFFPSGTFNWMLNFIGIALFVGLTAYSTNMLKQMGRQIDSHPARGGLVVLGALNLYLNFINLFLLLLRVSNR